MRSIAKIAGLLAVVLMPVLPAAADTAGPATLTYAVMRDGSPIGTSTVRLDTEAGKTTAEIVTHVQVKIAFITVYRYDQTETEQWSDGRLMAMHAVTDDNGTVHKVNARRQGEKLVVEADGKASEIDAGVMPFSLWNAALIGRTLALNTQDGKVTPVSVVDRGEEQLVLQGRATPAHHYSIRTTFPQDVWYDHQKRLVKVELRGSDGSRIQYRPG